jgi:predicted  nucleic acid-binding Zn-ribbon protein
VDPVLQNLIRYQELSLALSRLNTRLAEFPVQIKSVDAELEAASGSLVAARLAMSDHQKERRKLEAEVQDFEAKLKKYNEQLMQVKTNDEYRAMQHEIAGVKEKIGGVEEKILGLMEEAETGDRRIKEEEKALEVRKKEAEARKALVRQEESTVQQEADRLKASQQDARASLTQEMLDLFNRIAQGRNGVALARAVAERCGGCNVRLRPHLFQEIKRNDQIIQCDSCRRILFYIAEAPASDTAPA